MGGRRERGGGQRRDRESNRRIGMVLRRPSYADDLKASECGKAAVIIDRDTSLHAK